MWVGVNAVTHKSFYEAAAAEVAAGRLDNALWIKVNADLPGADNSARQAKYIALRAQELATEKAGDAVRGWFDFFRGRRWYWWASFIVVVYIALFIVSVPFMR